MERPNVEVSVVGHEECRSEDGPVWNRAFLDGRLDVVVHLPVS
jgi:hypothetical protein